MAIAFFHFIIPRERLKYNLLFFYFILFPPAFSVLFRFNFF